jgi:methylated-DNA-protein-cysteine methyltransferase-like protein
MSDTYARIYAEVRKIPRGRVATYGQIAALTGLKGHARQVGYALYALKSSTAVPWQRVINAQGRISLRLTTGGLSQRLLLEREGVVFDAGGRVSLRKFGWRPSVFAKTGRRARQAAE